MVCGWVAGVAGSLAGGAEPPSCGKGREAGQDLEAQRVARSRKAMNDPSLNTLELFIMLESFLFTYVTSFSQDIIWSHRPCLKPLFSCGAATGPSMVVSTTSLGHPPASADAVPQQPMQGR